MTPTIENDLTSVGASSATVRAPDAWSCDSSAGAAFARCFCRGLLGRDDRHVVLGDDDLGGRVDVLAEAPLDLVLPDHDGTQQDGHEAEGDETQDHAPRTHVSPIVKSGRTGKR